MKRPDPRQRSLHLQINLRPPTEAELRAAYDACVFDKQRLPFEAALEHRSISLALKNFAQAAQLRRRSS